MNIRAADPVISADPAITARRANKVRNTGIRRYFAVEENVRIVSFAQSNTGRLALFLLFVPVLALVKSQWLPLSLGAALCAYSGQYRSYALTLATLGVLGLNTSWFGLYPMDPVQAAAYAGFFTVSMAYLVLARRFQKMFAARHPLVTLLISIAFLLSLANSGLITGQGLALLWAFTEVFVKFVWFLAYALADQKSRSCSPLHFQFGVFRPFWGSTMTPIGKGAAYLRKVMAKTPQELAVTQIKGVKLLYWSLVLDAIYKALKWVVYGQLHLPPLADVQSAHAAGHPYSLMVGWASLIWSTADSTFHLAIVSHRVVAIARLAGYRLQRNTWRPLESQTLAEFWNRYYFYFKELLVEFFFYPTFLSTFRNYPRLRVFFATFMAAGVGNVIYHFIEIEDIQRMRTMGFWNAISGLESYVFYAVVLSIGIGISQARTHRPATSVLGWLWSFACVWSFVVVLHVFGDEGRVYSLGERLLFIFSLFGGQ